MEIYRPLRAALFLYECIRLAVLIGVFSLLRPGYGAEPFPWLVYAVPNVLFPLMTLFIWRRFSRYGAYMPLYISAKCIALAAMFGFCLFSRQDVYTALYLRNPGVFMILGSLLFLLFGDLFSAAGGLALVKKLQGNEETAGTAPAKTAGEQGGS
ncbi:MAG: hypothetical protein LBG10_03160 [Treponema sp.]|jgi:hypothetical protein|nr:hypothetical protein [Treponema sp.]